MSKYVFKKINTTSGQIIETDNMGTNGVIEPFVPFEQLLNFYYTNAYHRRSIDIKAQILSQIQDSTLQEFIPENINSKQFLHSFILNLEIFGNAFLEKSGDAGNFFLHLLPTIEARVDRDGNVFQQPRFTMGNIPLTGYHLKYYSPNSRFYGEPDYLSVFMQLSLENKINQYNNTFFENNAKPEMAIIFEGCEPSDQQLTAFKTFFQDNFKGYQNAHKTLVISAQSDIAEKIPKIRIEKLNETEDMSFKSLKDVNRDEIITAHGVPPRLVGIITAGQLGGAGEFIGQLHNFNEITIKPKIEILENFFDNIGITLKIKPLDITTFKDDADVISQLVSMGIISMTEAREILGWQKKEIQNGI